MQNNSHRYLNVVVAQQWQWQFDSYESRVKALAGPTKLQQYQSYGSTDSQTKRTINSVVLIVETSNQLQVMLTDLNNWNSIVGHKISYMKIRFMRSVDVLQGRIMVGIGEMKD